MFSRVRIIVSSRVPLIDRLIATSTYRLMDTLGELYFANARSLRIFEKLVPCYRSCSRGKYSVICGGDFRSFPRRWQLTAVRGKRVYAVNAWLTSVHLVFSRIDNEAFEKSMSWNVVSKDYFFSFLFFKVFLFLRKQEKDQWKYVARIILRISSR